MQVAGVVTLNGDGSATGTLNWNDPSGSAPQAPIPCTGTYTVDSTGRVTVSNLTDDSTFTYTLHFYLSGGSNALVLSDDTNAVSYTHLDVYKRQQYNHLSTSN